MDGNLVQAVFLINGRIENAILSSPLLPLSPVTVSIFDLSRGFSKAIVKELSFPLSHVKMETVSLLSDSASHRTTTVHKSYKPIYSLLRMICRIVYIADERYAYY